MSAHHYARGSVRRGILGFLVLASLSRANSQDPSGKRDGSWTASSQTASENTSPTRTSETYTKVGNRSIHKMTTEVLAPGGGYQPYWETESETIQEDAKSGRTIVRSYSPGPNGGMLLVQVMEEKKQQLPSGEMGTVRTTSNPDEYDNLKVVQQEVGHTKKAGPGLEETQTTIYRADERGTLVTTTNIQEEKKAVADGRIQTTRTTTALDLSGTWEVTERVQTTEKTGGQNRTAESVISRPDFEGNLSEVTRTASRQSQTDGQVLLTTQRYSKNVPGASPDGRFYLVEQTTASQRQEPKGAIAEQKTEHFDPVGGELKVMMTTSSISTAGQSGGEGTTLTSVRGLDGDFSIVSSETRRTTQIPIQVQMSPADQQSTSAQK